MVSAKNYEIVSTFVKVMKKKRWPLFFRTRCILESLQTVPKIDTILYS